MNHSQGKSHCCSQEILMWNLHLISMWKEISVFALSLASVPCFILTVSQVQAFFFFFHLGSVAKIIWGHAILPHKGSKGCLLFINLPQLSGVASISHATFPSSNLPLYSPLHLSSTRLVIPQSTMCLPAFGHVLFSEWEELSLYLAYLNSAHPYKSLFICGEFLSPTPGNEWLSYLYSTRWLSFCFLLG